MSYRCSIRTCGKHSKGFFHGLVYYPQIWQRYFHFILASFAIAGIYLYFWNNRLHKKAKRENKEDQLNVRVQNQGKKLGLQTMIWTTALQLLSGTWLLMSFDRDIRLLYMGDDPLVNRLINWVYLNYNLADLFLSITHEA